MFNIPNVKSNLLLNLGTLYRVIKHGNAGQSHFKKGKFTD